MSRRFIAGIAVAAACACVPAAAVAGSCIVNPGSETYSVETGSSAASAVCATGAKETSSPSQATTEPRFVTYVRTQARALVTFLKGIMIMVN